MDEHNDEDILPDDPDMDEHINEDILPDDPGMQQNPGPIAFPQWVQGRLESQFDDTNQAPLEASLYGIVNTLLFTQFPLDRRFMIKPQAGLRMTPFRVASQHGPTNTSGGSSSNEIPIYPDFVVVRAHRRLSRDWTLCIVEIKREGEGDTDTRAYGDAEGQVIRYLVRAACENIRIGTLKAFLVWGNNVYAYSIDSLSHEVTEGVDIGRSDGDGFKQALFNIARKYWDNTDVVQWRVPNFQGPYEPPAQM